MNKLINFYDKSIEIFFLEEGISLKDALGDNFNEFAVKFLKGIDKAFYELPIEKEYKNLFSCYRGFNNIKLKDLFSDFSIPKDEEFIKEYENKFFNIRALTILEEELKFGCLVIDPERTIYEGVKKIIEVGKESFMCAFEFNGEYRVIVLMKF